MSKLVSIITATYNDEAFIQECIDSVMAQTHTRWEWIIVNNGSTDRTAQFLSQINDDRVSVLKLTSNVGVSAGRNEALKQAKGDFLCFLDGDDVLPENSILARVEVLESDPGIDFADGVVHSFKGDIGNVIDVYKPRPKGHVLADLLSLDGSIFMGNTWMLRVHSEKSYQFDPELTHGEELLLYASLACDGRYAYTDHLVLHYRRHESSAMQNIGGLLTGYIGLAKKLESLGHVRASQLRQFRKKASSIMVRTFLKQGNILGAIKAYTSLNSA